MKHTALLITAMGLLAACGTESYSGKPPMLKEDKHLTCEELELEMNDARFLLEQAQENRGLNFKNIIWPVGYPQTYASAAEAIDVTNKRLAYLHKIYEIKNCDTEYGRKR